MSEKGGAKAGAESGDSPLWPTLITGAVIVGSLYLMSKGETKTQAEWNRKYGRKYLSPEKEAERHEKYSGSWRDRAAHALGMKTKRDYDEEARIDRALAKRARRLWLERGDIDRAVRREALKEDDGYSRAYSKAAAESSDTEYDEDDDGYYEND